MIRLRAPSYFCDNETEKGLQLHYRSKRRGFVHYTIGQLKSIAETFYKIDMQIEVLDQEVKFDTIQVSFQAGIPPAFPQTNKFGLSPTLPNHSYLITSASQ